MRDFRDYEVDLSESEQRGILGEGGFAGLPIGRLLTKSFVPPNLVW
jgi:hypothetical protein